MPAPERWRAGRTIYLATIRRLRLAFGRRTVVPLMVGAVLLLGACGPLGDDDEEPTPTVAAGSLPASTIPATPDATPTARPAGAATPVAAVEGSPTAIQGETTSADDRDPLAADEVGTTRRAGTPRPSATQRTVRVVATLPRAEPSATRARATATREPADGPTEKPEPPVASNCEPPEPVPSVQASGPLVTTGDLVNLRSGPGTACDPIDQLPLGAEVTPLSGPVEADGRLWLLVETGNQTEGWVASQFLDEQ